MKKSIFTISIFLYGTNALALVASDVDMSTAVTDTATIVASILSFMVILMGYKKVLTLLGR